VEEGTCRILVFDQFISPSLIQYNTIFGLHVAMYLNCFVTLCAFRFGELSLVGFVLDLVD